MHKMCKIDPQITPLPYSTYTYLYYSILIVEYAKQRVSYPHKIPLKHVCGCSRIIKG